MRFLRKCEDMISGFKIFWHKISKWHFNMEFLLWVAVKTYDYKENPIKKGFGGLFQL